MAERGSGDGSRQIMIRLIGLLVVAGPVAAFIWHELSEALLGRPHWSLLLVAVLLLGALLGALTLVARRMSGPGRS